MAELRNLVIVLGDQLDLYASAFDGFDPERDAVWMAGVTEESTHVWSSKPRIALFRSTVRHFAVARRGKTACVSSMSSLKACSLAGTTRRTCKCALRGNVSTKRICGRRRLCRIGARAAARGSS